MKGFEYNKYALKLEEMVKNGEDNEKVISRFRRKANELRQKKSLELMRFINTPDLIDGAKDLKKIDDLIKSGADIDYTTSTGITPFIIAAMNGQIIVADFLKENGADVFVKNKEGQNALMLTLFISQMSRSGEFYSHKKVSYPKMLRQLRAYGLGDNMHCDFMGLTLNDYLMGEFEPFKNTLIKRCRFYLNKNNYNKYMEEENDNIL